MDEADVLWETKPEQALAIYLEMLDQIERATAGWAQVYGDPFEELFGSALNGVLSLVSEDRLPQPARQRAVKAAFKLPNVLALVQSEEFPDFAAELNEAEHAELQRHLQSAHDSSTSSYLREHLARALLTLIPAAQQTPAQREALLLSRGEDAHIAEYFLTSQPPSAQRRKLTAYFTQTRPYTPLEPLFGLFEHHDAADVLEQILGARLTRPRMAGRLSAEDLWLFGRYAATQRREQAFKLAWTNLLDTALPEWERLSQSVSLNWAKDWKKALKAFEQRPGLKGLGNPKLLSLLLSGDHDLAEAHDYDRLHQGRYADTFVIHQGVGRSVTWLRTELAQQLGEVPDYRARAADIRLELATRFAAQRGREQYQAAAAQLKHLSKLIGQPAASAHLSAFAQAHKNLPALQEELRKAKLL